MAVPLKHTWHPVITLLLNHLHGQVSKIFLLSENTEKGKIGILVGQPITWILCMCKWFSP